MLGSTIIQLLFQIAKSSKWMSLIYKYVNWLILFAVQIVSDITWFDMESKRGKLQAFDRYPELSDKIRNRFGMLGHQTLGLQGNLGEDQLTQVFEKIKLNFFDSHLDNENISELIRTEPLAYFTRSVFSVIKYYQQTLEALQKQSRQESNQYKKQMASLKEKVSDYITLTQALKDGINQLEQQKQNTELRLNQSESNLGLTQSKQQIQYIQRKSLEQEKLNAINYSCKLQKEIDSLHQQIQQYQRQERAYTLSKNEYLLLKKQNEQLKMAHIEALQKIIQLQQDLELVKNKYHEKAQLYERFVQEHNHRQNYNVCQFSSPALSRQTFGQQRIRSRGYLQRSNELNGLIFNLTDSQEMTSKASQLSIGDNLNIIDYQSTPYQLSKSPSCGDNRVAVEKQSLNINSVKKSIKIEQSTSKKFDINVSKQKSFKKGQMFSQTKPLHSNTKEENKISHFNPSSGKKVNSLAKNLNSPNTKEYIDGILKEKLNEKNLHIQKLQGQLQAIRALCASQKQNLTMMQGDYEIKLEELKDLLAYTKKQLKLLFRKYCSNKVLCESYQSQINELEEEIQILRLQYKQYCSLLQNKCKEYIMTTLTNIEQEYLEMVEWMNSNKNRIQEANEVQASKEAKAQNILIFDDKTEDNESAQKVQSESDVFSLDFQKMKKVRQNNSTSEIFICDKLEIQSALSFKISHNDNIKGHFTERTSKTVQNYPEIFEGKKFVRRINHLKISSNEVCLAFTSNRAKEWKICNLQYLSVKRKSFKIQSSKVEFTVQPFEVKQQKLKICSLNRISLSKKFLQLSSGPIMVKFTPQTRPKSLQTEFEYKILPHIQAIKVKKQNQITTFSILSLEPPKKHRQIIGQNIFHHIPKQPTLSITKINVIAQTFHQERKKPSLLVELQRIISIPALNIEMVDKCIETDNIRSLSPSNQTSPERSSFISNVSYLQKMGNQLLRVKVSLLEELQKKNMQNKSSKYQKKSTITSKIYDIIVSSPKNKQTTGQTMQRAKDTILKQNEQHIQIKVETSKQISNSVSNLIQEVKIMSECVSQEMESNHQIKDNMSESSDDEIIKMFPTERVIETDEDSSERKVYHRGTSHWQENIDPNMNENGKSLQNRNYKGQNEITNSTRYELTIAGNQNWRDLQSFERKQIQRRRAQVPLSKVADLCQESHQGGSSQDFQCDESVSLLLEQRQIKLMLKYLPSRKLKLSIKTEYSSISHFFTQKRSNQSTFCYLFLTKQDQTRKTHKIVITNKYLIELSTNKDIVFENCRRYFDTSNFMFGQAEIILTKTGILDINRKNKCKKLKGSLPDCRYQVQKLFSLKY